MKTALDPNSLDQIRAEIESFLRTHPNIVLLEDNVEVLELPPAEWRVGVEYGKLLFEAWNGVRSIMRRVDDIAYRDEGRLGFFAWKAGGRKNLVIELRERGVAASASPEGARNALRRDLTTYLKKYFPEWRLERISNRSDREHSFSAWYMRGLARQRRIAWAFIGLDPSESFAAADAALAYGLNWLDWLRERSEDCVISSLKLFLPPAAIPLTALRAAHLNQEAVGIEIFAWPNDGPPEPIRPGDLANAETRLTHRREADWWISRHRDFLRHVFGELIERMDTVPDAAATALSFRVFGLEIARMEGYITPRLFWGMEGDRRVYREDERQDFRDFAELVLARRHAQSRDTTHLFYRANPERWLESLLVRDLSKLDPALRPDPVYPQVPAFSGMDRGVVDILSITRDGRLAVIELKLHEEITLPLQGLDYWLRVKWLNDRRQFHDFGYFPGLEISPAPPLLYLVSPAFRFHPSNERIMRYFHPSVDVVTIGLNQQWREGVKVLFRHGFRSTS